MVPGTSKNFAGALENNFFGSLWGDWASEHELGRQPHSLLPPSAIQ